MSFTDISHYGTDHIEWMNSLDFYNKELAILVERLQEIAAKNNSSEAVTGIEHFQNQFFVQRGNIDELKQIIHWHTFKVAGEAQANTDQTETVLDEGHEEVNEQFNTFQKVFNDLRHEFNGFASKWM